MKEPRRFPIKELLKDPEVRRYFNEQAVRSARFFNDNTFIPKTSDELHKPQHNSDVQDSRDSLG